MIRQLLDFGTIKSLGGGSFEDALESLRLLLDYLMNNDDGNNVLTATVKRI